MPSMLPRMKIKCNKDGFDSMAFNAINVFRMVDGLCSSWKRTAGVWVCAFAHHTTNMQRIDATMANHSYIRYEYPPLCCVLYSTNMAAAVFVVIIVDSFKWFVCGIACKVDSMFNHLCLWTVFVQPKSNGPHVVMKMNIAASDKLFIIWEIRKSFRRVGVQPSSQRT